MIFDFVLLRLIMHVSTLITDTTDGVGWKFLSVLDNLTIDSGELVSTMSILHYHACRIAITILDLPSYKYNKMIIFLYKFPIIIRNILNII